MNNSWPIPQCGYEPYVRERQQQQLVTWTCAPSLPALDRMKQRYRYVCVGQANINVCCFLPLPCLWVMGTSRFTYG